MKIISRIIPVAVVAWFLFSWVDVIAHNMDPEPIYQAWNFFLMLGGAV